MGVMSWFQGPWLQGRKFASSLTLEGLFGVFAGARQDAEGLAQVPLKLFRVQEYGRAPAEDHPLYQLLDEAPNDE